jgi:hypothetical protein
MAVGARHSDGQNGPGWTDVSLTLDLPIGEQPVVVAMPPLPSSRPQVGDAIDAKVWRGQVTDVRLAGATYGGASRPVTRFLFLVGAAGVMVVLGLLFLVGYVVDHRAGYV